MEGIAMPHIGVSALHYVEDGQFDSILLRNREFWLVWFQDDAPMLEAIKARLALFDSKDKPNATVISV